MLATETEDTVALFPMDLNATNSVHVVAQVKKVKPGIIYINVCSAKYLVFEILTCPCSLQGTECS